MKRNRVLIVGLGVLLAGFGTNLAVRKLRAFGTLAGSTVPVKGALPAMLRSLRPNYPYSVIPGGAYSPAELRYADKTDEQVRAHYADFNLASARMEQLTEDRFQYVSYRMKKQIYWTRRRLRIPKGEYVLTDGKNYARARCGNRLSSSSHKELGPNEPSQKVLSLPPFRPEALPNFELAQAPPLGEIQQQYAELPDSSSRFAPIFPANGPTKANGFDELPLLPPFLPMAPVFPSAILTGGNNSYTPAGGTSGSTTTGALVPLSPNTPPPAVSTIPEPGSIYLFAVTLVISLYGLLRMLQSGDRAGHKPSSE